jgi:SSS family solute:Na+ symporter
MGANSTALEDQTLSAASLDGAVVLVYLLGIVALGLRSSGSSGQRRVPTAPGATTDEAAATAAGDDATEDAAAAADFFLAGRSLRWPVIGVALFATNISTIHVVGLAGSGFSVGLVMGNFEWFSPFTLMLLGVLFAPFYFTNRVATLPEYLERRYSPQCRSMLAFMGIVAALFIHIGVSLYAGAILCNNFFGVPILVSIFAVSFLTAVYTLVGGLRAVVITEVVQTVILLLGSVIIFVAGVAELWERGITSLEQLRVAASTDGVNRMSMIHSSESDPGYPFYTFILGYPGESHWLCS